MILEVKEEQEITIARIQIKEADLTQAEQLKSEMLALVDAGNNHILVDFRDVTYVDSSFLGAMVSSLKYAMSKKSDIAIINLSEDIRDLFNLVRLNKVFNIYPSKSLAIIAASK